MIRAETYTMLVYRQILAQVVAYNKRLIRRRIVDKEPLPTITEAGVRCHLSYDLKDAESVYRTGFGDADSLACWRAAELKQQGINASVKLIQIPRPGGGITVTCRVKLPDGSYDSVFDTLVKK